MTLNFRQTVFYLILQCFFSNLVVLNIHSFQYTWRRKEMYIATLFLYNCAYNQFYVYPLHWCTNFFLTSDYMRIHSRRLYRCVCVYMYKWTFSRSTIYIVMIDVLKFKQWHYIINGMIYFEVYNDLINAHNYRSQKLMRSGINYWSRRNA